MSDAASLAGLPPGTVKWMGKDISIEQEAHGLVIRDPEFKCLAGSAATMVQCVNYLHSLKILEHPLRDLERLAFHNPLRFVGLPAPSRKVASMKVTYSRKTGFVVAPL